jgi:hypothetical protein
MNTIENDIKMMQIKIIGSVCIYCVLLLSFFSFVTLKIDVLFGLGLILVFLLLILFFTIPSYKTRLGLGKNFCLDIMKLASPLSGMLPTIRESNSNNEILVNVYSFDSKFRLVINPTTPSLKKLEDQCNTISNKLSEILNEYDVKQNGRIYVNFDSLLVGIIALLLLDCHIYDVRVTLRLSIKGYSEHFTFMDDGKKSAIREIKHSIIYQSL